MDDPAASRNVFQRATETALYLRVALPDTLQHPKVAIVCGSGLGGLAETIHPEPRLETAYANIPNFPQSTVQGHAGKLIFGLIGPAKTPVVLLVGRAQLVTFSRIWQRKAPSNSVIVFMKDTPWTLSHLLLEFAKSWA